MESDVRSTRPTPLPKLQLSILALIQFSEPVTALVIYPFIIQFVRDTGVTGGDESKTGHYAGIIESVFFLAECLTVVYFGRASDRYGRRPVLLVGPLGLALSMLGFGLSKRFWGLLLFRCLQGAFNGNIGVSKSVMAEIADPTNVAQIYSFLPIIWTVGAAVGPFLGGTLADPVSRYPDTLGKIPLLREFPYFLPCAAAGGFALVAFIIAVLGLKETLPSALARQKKQKAQKQKQGRRGTETEPLLADSTHLTDATHAPISEAAHAGLGRAQADVVVEHTPHVQSEEAHAAGSEYTSYDHDSTEDEDGPPPLRGLFVRPVRVALLSHAFLCFCQMSYDVLVPLVYATPISMGGLGLSPLYIGRILATVGLVNVVVQPLFAARVIRYFGPRTIFIAAFCVFAAGFLAYPLLTAHARRVGAVDALAAALIAAQMGAGLVINPTFACTQLFVVDSAPSPASLGGVNGIAQMVSSIQRSVAPVVVASLFAVSAAYRQGQGSGGGDDKGAQGFSDFLAGNLVYVVMGAVSLCGVRGALMLPRKLKFEGRQ
ncbi:major facilitator superfamily multidrug-resistance, DHA1 sub-family [Mycena crocata]|nr:major facilitator superfamily multidrug-resistance, DHA1 sub-family [Mycena crocata]